LDGTFFIQLTIFLLVLVSLNLLVFKPLRRHQENRDRSFDSLGDEIKTVENESNQKVSEYGEKIDRLKSEIQLIKTEIKQKTDKERDDILEKARLEADGWLQKEEEELKAAAEESRRFLNTRTRQLASEIFTRIMGRSPEAGL
jgi:F-type H+-transporting ATPase subunit b